MKQIIKSEKHFQFVKTKRAKALTVVFSTFADVAPSFSFWKNFQNINTHIIFLNCNKYDWYRNGIPGLSTEISEVVDQIKAFQKQVGATRIYTVGSSMGAYGAVLYGSLLQADRVLAFGLEPVMGIVGARSEMVRNYLQYVHPDLTTLDLPPITLFYGGVDTPDTLGAWLLRKHQQVNIYCIPHAEHNTPQVLNDEAKLVPLFKDLVRGSDLSHYAYSVGDIEDDATIKVLWKINDLVNKQSWQHIIAFLDKHPNQLAKSNLLQYIKATTLFKLRNYKEAANILIPLAENNPNYWAIWLNLASCETHQKHFDSALNFASIALKFRPTLSIIHNVLAGIYTKSANFEMAYQHARIAFEINKTHPRYESELNNIKGKLTTPVDFIFEDDVKEIKVFIKKLDTTFKDIHFFKENDVAATIESSKISFA